MFDLNSDLLQQDAPGIIRNSGIPRWGCLIRTMQSYAEEFHKTPLIHSEIMYLLFRWTNPGIVPITNYGTVDLEGSYWDGLDPVPLVVVKRVDSTGRPELWCMDIARITTETLHFYGYRDHSCELVGNLEADGHCDFTALHGTTASSRALGYGGHWVRGDTHGEILWDPCKSIRGFQLDGKGFKFRHVRNREQQTQQGAKV